MSREKYVAKHLNDLCEQYHMFNRRLEWIGRNDAADNLIISPKGELVFIETKSLTGLLSPGQCYEHAVLRSYKQRVEVPHTKEEVTLIIESLL